MSYARSPLFLHHEDRIHFSSKTFKTEPMKQLLPSCFSIAAACLLVSGAAQANPVVGMAERAPAIDHSDRKVVPSGFEENKGQVLTITGEVAPFVRYRLSQGNTNIFLLGSGIAYQFSQRHYPEGYAELEKDARLNPAKQRELDALNKEVMLETYRMDVLLDGANTDARITTEDRSADHTQYYGQNALDVHTYSRVTYHEVYPGIDWVVYTTAKGMKYDFVLRPGSDPAMIQLRFKDHEELRLDGDGQLVHGNRMGRFTEEQPVSFQNGKEVGTSFVLEGDRLSFALDSYDRSQPLTIDPDRIWGTYYGGAGSEYNISCAADGSGNVYLSGNTGSLTGIASGGYQTTYGGGDDAFLVKFNADGVRQWGTYYGGAGLEYSGSCVVDDGGNVYLVGTTTSTATIASGGYQNTLGGSRDAFLVKFNASGVRQWATYYGGSDFDSGLSCAIDGSGNIYLVGYTSSTTSVAFGGRKSLSQASPSTSSQPWIPKRWSGSPGICQSSVKVLQYLSAVAAIQRRNGTPLPSLIAQFDWQLLAHGESCCNEGDSDALPVAQRALCPVRR